MNIRNCLLILIVGLVQSRSDFLLGQQSVAMVDCWQLENIPCNEHPVQLCDDVQCKQVQIEVDPDTQQSNSQPILTNAHACPPGTDQIRRDAIGGDGNAYPVWRPTYIPEFGHITFQLNGWVDCALEVPCASGDCVLKANGKYYCQKDGNAPERKVSKPVVEGVNACILFEQPGAE